VNEPSPPPIKVRAIVLLTRGKEVLVVDHTDQHDGLVWGVVGGHIEFGERAEDAARREAMEETGFEPGELRLLSVFENIFEYAGETGHEVCFAFKADARGTALAKTDYASGQESDGSPLLLRWIHSNEIANGARVTWPHALRELVLQLPV
jgi:ADP-ribose pyrophosphatase YjhB (NUDIX family)